jgi:integrase
VSQGDAIEPPTVGEYLVQWLAHMRGRVRPNTHQGYETLIRVHALPALGALGLGDLASLDLQRLYGALLEPERKLAAGTVLNLHLVLTQALGQAQRWGMVAQNVAQGAQPPRPRRPEPVVVDRALAARLLEEARGTRFELAVAIALCTGMRRGEILALRWSDLDDSLETARVRRSLQTTRRKLSFEEPKTRRSRRAVALPEILRPYLEHQRAEQAERRDASTDWQDLDLVIDRGNGGPVNPDTVSSAWYRFCRQRGLPHVRFHDLRHAHATLMLLQGVHPKIVSERLGHASIGITLDLYSHVLPSMQEDAARAFDALFEHPANIGSEPTRLSASPGAP